VHEEQLAAEQLPQEEEKLLDDGAFWPELSWPERLLTKPHCDNSLVRSLPWQEGQEAVSAPRTRVSKLFWH